MVLAEYSGETEVHLRLGVSVNTDFKETTGITLTRFGFKGPAADIEGNRANYFFVSGVLSHNYLIKLFAFLRQLCPPNCLCYGSLRYSSVHYSSVVSTV